jgi:hypothetical protein
MERVNAQRRERIVKLYGACIRPTAHTDADAVLRWIAASAAAAFELTRIGGW